jgi:hypothetical protein
LLNKGRLPSAQTTGDHLLGQVSTFDRRVCSRLCMRVQGCAAFAFRSAPEAAEPAAAQGLQCYLYDAVLDATESSDGARYYALRTD